jgi:hypothetical protein
LGTSVSSPDSSSSQDSATSFFFLDAAGDLGSCAFIDSLFSVDSSSICIHGQRAASSVAAGRGAAEPLGGAAEPLGALDILTR